MLMLVPETSFFLLMPCDGRLGTIASHCHQSIAMLVPRLPNINSLVCEAVGARYLQFPQSFSWVISLLPYSNNQVQCLSAKRKGVKQKAPAEPICVSLRLDSVCFLFKKITTIILPDILPRSVSTPADHINPRGLQAVTNLKPGPRKEKSRALGTHGLAQGYSIFVFPRS